MTEVSFLASVAPEKFRCKDPSWSFIATLRMTNKLYHIVQVELYFVLFFSTDVAVEEVRSSILPENRRGWFCTVQYEAMDLGLRRS